MTSNPGENAAERALVDAARHGDRAALEKLLAQYEPSIYRFGMRMCHQREDAREVLQDTMLAAARAMPGFRGDAALGTWLFQIARRVCMRRRRRRKGQPAELESLDAQLPSEAPLASDRDPEEVTADHEVREALHQAIDALEPKYREVLLLRDVEGLSAEEVGATLNLSIAAVKSRLHRARVTVRERLTPVLDGVPAQEPPRTAECPDILTLMSKSLEGDIDHQVCSRLESHVASCERCKRACDGLRHTLALCRAAPAKVPKSVQDSVRRAVRAVVAPIPTTPTTE